MQKKSKRNKILKFRKERVIIGESGGETAVENEKNPLKIINFVPSEFVWWVLHVGLFCLEG